MEIEILAIGDPLKIKPIVADFLHSQKDNAFLVSVPKKLQKFLVSCFATEGIKAFPLPLFKKFFLPHKNSPQIHKITPTAFNWTKTGNAYFHLSYNGIFEMISLDRRIVKTVAKIEGISKCFMSNNGTIYAFIRGNLITLCIGDELNLIYDNKFDEIIGNVYFNDQDTLIGVECENFIYIYDIFKGLLIKKFNKEKFSFINNGTKTYLDDNTKIYLHHSNKIINLNDNNEYLEQNNFREYNKGKMASFIDGEYQKIIYNDNGKITSKSISHAIEIRFFFSKKRLYAVLTKNPGSNNFYILESYAEGQVISLNLEFRIEEISVDDDYVVIQLSDQTVEFYSREKHTFVLLNRIEREGKVILSQCGALSGIFDSSTNNVEFYDKGILRSIYAHTGCSGIEWSLDGLYAAAYSLNETGGSLVQIFNNNGVLVYKKVYNGLERFGWRGDVWPSEEEVKRILGEHKLEEIEEKDEDEDKDRDILVREWKEYLSRFIR